MGELASSSSSVSEPCRGSRWGERGEGERGERFEIQYNTSGNKMFDDKTRL